MLFTLMRPRGGSTANIWKKVVTRRNTVTGVLYREDPTILGWS